MLVHVACIRARRKRDHAKSHAVMPLYMALTNDLSSCRETHNTLIQRTLRLNFMPFGLLASFGETEWFGGLAPFSGSEEGRKNRVIHVGKFLDFPH
jgi:hypothetical protein